MMPNSCQIVDRLPHSSSISPLPISSFHPRFQWPEEEDVPGFKKTYLLYLDEVAKLSHEFVRLVAEALGLLPDGLAQFYDARERMQHRSKVRSIRGFVCVCVPV
jgi:isopenicillin N synthase-like dioxygenase